MIEVLSQVLLELYRLAWAVSFPEFQDTVLTLVQTYMPFDSAFWSMGLWQPDAGFDLHNTLLFNQSDEMLAGYAAVCNQDVLANAALLRTGTTVNAAIRDKLAGDGHGAVRAHAARYGMEHVLCTHFRDPVNQVSQFISLYRADPLRSYTEAERRFKERLMPHLAQACDISRVRHLELASLRTGHTDTVHAICGRDGTLYNIEPGFSHLLQSCWPAWRGPVLPDPIRERLAAAAEQGYRDSRLIVRAETVRHLVLLSARRSTVGDRLSRRESAVAIAYAKGMIYRDIAKQLNIAPNTVRRHLSAIYRKLGVSNKGELAVVLDVARVPCPLGRLSHPVLQAPRLTP